MPVFVAKHNELKLQEQGQSADSDDPYNKTFDMLGTIKVPLNLGSLKNNLPDSQYDSDIRAKDRKKNSESKRGSVERMVKNEHTASLGKIQEETEAEDTVPGRSLADNSTAVRDSKQMLSNNKR